MDYVIGFFAAALILSLALCVGDTACMKKHNVPKCKIVSPMFEPKIKDVTK